MRRTDSNASTHSSLRRQLTRGVSHVFGLGGEEDDGHRVLDVEKVKDRYRRYKTIKHGYMGLGLFLLFMSGYVWVLERQHRTTQVGGANAAFQTVFEKMKTDLKVTDASSLYSFITKTVVPRLLAERWTNQTSSGTQIGGSTALGSFHVLTGLTITAVKGPVTSCYEGNPCYQSSKLEDPFYMIAIPGSAAPYAVPYCAQLGGYSVSVPSTSGDISALLAAYTALFGPDTREIWIHAVLFNPSGRKVVTSLAFGGAVSLDNNVEISSQLRSMPYHWYGHEGMWQQVVFELVVVAFFVWGFVAPLLRYLLCEPNVKNFGTETEFRMRWVAWSQEWKHLPAQGGRPLLGTPVSLFITLFISIGLWLALGVRYLQFGELGHEGRFAWTLKDPLADAGSDISSKMDASLASMHQHVLPLMACVDELTTALSRYFVVHVIVMTLMVVRLQQYLAFQKRLSIVTDTFSGIFDDLLHMGVVMLLVCFFFGVISSLAFGVYDQSFQSFMQAFFEMVLVCFGMFRPSATSPFVYSLFKYSPHTLQDNEYQKWLPMLLQIFFKTLVVMLLFKLLMGVIMESYKRHSKMKDKAHTVRQDLMELWDEAYHYVWGHLVKRGPFVPFIHVSLGLAQLEASDERPWEKYFLGLDHHQAIEDALNAIFSDSMSQRVKARVAHNKLKRCGRPEVDFVLSVFGTNRAKAEVAFAEIWEHKVKKVAAKLEHSHQEDLEREQEEHQKREEAMTDVQQMITAMRHHHLGGPESTPRLLTKKKIWRTDEITDIFNEYDLEQLGHVDHRLMHQLFLQLGFDISNHKLAQLLVAYDHNVDGGTTLKELRDILRDDKLIGHWQDPGAHGALRISASHPADHLKQPLLP